MYILVDLPYAYETYTFVFLEEQMSIFFNISAAYGAIRTVHHKAMHADKVWHEISHVLKKTTQLPQHTGV